MMRLFTSGTFFHFSAYSPSTSFPSRTLLLNFSQFSTSSSSQYSFHSSYSSRREEEFRNVRVSVWWDFENCNLPAGVNVFKVAHLITAAVRANGIKGPVQITAFGDILQLSRANQEALSSTGISLTHIPHGGKNSADRSLLVDLMYWVSQNPPPAHLFLISGDRDFANILHRLRMNNYNVLLASPENAPGVLCSAASIMWQWNALIRGENLVGKHFNQPPDGPYGSWYGHYKVPLEDPFPLNEQPSSSRTEEVADPSSDPKPRPVPKTVIKQIRHILNMYPKGISITELRSELTKSSISIDKEYYGHKKFSRFLLSMPHILKLQTNSDGQFIVRVNPRAVEPFESSRGTSEASSGSGDQDLNVTTKLNINGSSKRGGAMNASFLPSNESNIQDRSPNVQHSECRKSICGAKEGEPAISNVFDSQATEVSMLSSELEADNNLYPSTRQHPKAENGFLKKIWKWFLGGNDHNSEDQIHNVSEKCTSDDASEEKSHGGLVTTYASDSLGEAKTEGKTVKTMSQDDSSAQPVSYSPVNEPAILRRKTTISRPYDDKASSGPGFLGRIGELFKFWKSDTVDGKVSEQSGKHELLSKTSFWQDMESFMGTPNAVELISRSRTRSEMAQNLLGEGPSILKSLSKSDLLDLVELLISDKKWVEESPSQTKPFKLAESIARKSFCSKPLNRSNGLTSIFLNRVSQTNLQEFSDLDSDEKNENMAPAEVSMTKCKVPDRTRSEILGDCQKLVNEILRAHPEGYNLGAFRRLFLEKYGYHLDLPKLGYQKLTSLLQIMPGVAIESTIIVPTSKAPNGEKKVSHIVANSDGDSSEPSEPSRNDEFESTWEELGPVAYTSNRNEEESVLSREAAEARDKRSKVDYEPALSDDDLTDSDGELLPTTQGSEMREKQRINEEDSSLLQILDSWYSNKEDGNRKDKTEHTDGMIDCSASSLRHSSLSAETDANVGSFARKKRHQKSYSFVSDTDENDKEKLIDGILGTLKKSSKSRMHN